MTPAPAKITANSNSPFAVGNCSAGKRPPCKQCHDSRPSLLSPHGTARGRALPLTAQAYDHKGGCFWLSSEGLGKSRNRNFPSRCARRGESLSVLRGQNTALNFKGRCPQGPQQTHSTKMFDELPWQASTVQINDWKSLVYVSVEEDKFSLGFGNLRDWETQLTTAPLPSFTMLYHGSFTFYISFQRVFINLSETDSMSVFCFFCNTMATKWLEIVFGLV